ncbi:MAG TPA: hypothetical protein VL096_07970, partial [Pirellulaceae bacterium]|nr:hypothetical protein [Pirellulaceae bacterium]
MKADVPTGWTIDSVETVPAEALDDWNFTPQAGQPQKLNVRLSQAISTQRGVRVIVIGHRRALPARGNQPRVALASHEYRLAEFQQVTERRRLVSAQADSQQQLGLVGDIGIVRLEPSALVDTERTLFENGAGRLLFLDDSVSANFGLRVRSESPRYAATIQLIATLKPTSLSELCRIRCVPEATPVARVLVQFSPSGAVSPSWQLDQEPAGEFTARLLTDAERRATALTDGETWEITLQRPRSAPFELTAQRTRSIPRGPEPHAVSLVSLPQADSQTGQIEVHASEGAIPSIQSFDLKPLMPEPPAYNAISTQQAVFRYTPAQEQRLMISHRPEESRTAALWAWNAILTSRIGSSGRCVHALRYELENTGRPSVQLQLLDSQTLREVRVNGTRVVALAVAQQQTLTIPLPPRERYCTLQVEYEETCPTQAILAKTHLRWPQLDAPILNHRLRLCVPPGLALADASQPASWGWQAQPDWRSRLFGALARPESSRPPSLFSFDDWYREFQQEPIPVALRRRGEACLQAWDQLLAPARDTSRAETLGEWAQRYDRLASDNPAALRPLRIDAMALTHYGWYGDSRLATATAGGSLTSGELLRRAGLVFVLTEDSLILTTRDQITPARAGWELAPQLLFVSSATTDDDSFDTTLGVKAWLALPQTARSPWPAEPLNTLSDLEASGWRVYHLSLGDEASTAIVLCRQHEILALAWGIFLAVAACMYWVGRRRIRLWIIGTSGAALLALILPGPLVPCGTAIFLGSLVAGIALAARHDRKVYRVIAPGSTMTHALPRVTAPAVVIIALAGCWLTVSYAQEATESEKKTPPVEVQRVLIPVDDD